MPLFANLIRLDYCDRRLDTFDTVVQNFGQFYKEKADKLKSEQIMTIRSSDLCLYVGLQEEGGVRKSDRRIKMLGTDRLKTSTAVVLSCEKGAVLSHFNASSATHSVVSMMDAIRKIMIGRLSFPNRESFPGKSDMNLHLIGGYDDQEKLSERLTMKILQMFCRGTVGDFTEVNVKLKTFCCGKMNSELMRCGPSIVQAPIINGFVVDVNTEEIIPARFCEEVRGPLSFARAVRRRFASGPITRIYDWKRHQFVLAEFEYREWNERDMDEFNIVTTKPVGVIFEKMSSSPHLEPEDFPEHLMELYTFRRANPDPKETFFPNRSELILVKSGSEWINVDDATHDRSELQRVSYNFLS